VKLLPGEPTCSTVADLLPALALGECRGGRRARGHVEACLRCQAEVARYRRTARQLRALRAVPAPVPPGSVEALVAEVLAAIDGAWTPRASQVRRRVACVGGVCSVATVAGAGVLVWMGRRRPLVAG
jgi:hypothetical protein